MKLDAILQGIDFEILQGTTDKEINEIKCSSETVEKNDLFVCIDGQRKDGHQFIAESVEKGATAVVISKTPRESLPPGVTVIKSSDTRKDMALMAANFYEYPYEKLITVGITGTKGKTTVGHMIRAILEQAGIRTGLIGSVEIYDGKKSTDSEMTTPESVFVQKSLSDMVKNHCKAAIIEVSSQGLKQERVTPIEFDYGIFTNLGKDHISPAEHAHLQEYTYFKSLLFRHCKVGIINGDDSSSELILRNHKCSVVKYGFGPDNQYIACNPRYIRKGYMPEMQFQVLKQLQMPEIQFQVSKLFQMSENEDKMTCTIPMPGRFNCMNALAAIAVCESIGIKSEDICKALKSFSVAGRQEVFTITGEETIIVDFAHNGYALENLLKALREYRPSAITCLFGCGGERDRERRYSMGRAAAKYADNIIITSDNPRNEPQTSIISDIINEISRFDTPYEVIEDRGEAIRYAVSKCRKNEMTVIAGKGQETYQIIGSERYHFDDREEILKSIEKVNYEKVHIK